MKILTVAEVQAVEKTVIEKRASAELLMERAGIGAAERIRRRFPRCHKALVTVGKGNNGGDGLVVARELSLVGWEVTVVLCSGGDSLGELPAKKLTEAQKASPQILIGGQLSEDVWPGPDGIVVDALLGIGAEGPLRGTVAQAVEQINRARRRRFFRTVALDCPTGIVSISAEKDPSPDNLQSCLVADVTLTIGVPKADLIRETLSHWVGSLEVVPILESEEIIGGSRGCEFLTAPDLSPLLPLRSAYSHKKTYGRILLVGGSEGYTGAPVLAAAAALRTGAGLVHLAVPLEIYEVVAAKAPAEVMVSSWEDSSDLQELAASADAIGVGPGMGISKESAEVLSFLMTKFSIPVVADADALNLLASQSALLKQRKAETILTPHVGEMRRLIGREFSVNERESVALEYARAYQSMLMLKGSRTLIASPNGNLAINGTGNAGMATGGTGDALTGILTALVGQRMRAWDAARLGCWLHGCAGEIASARRGCEEGTLPGDLIDHLGEAIVRLRAG